jgi:hypothetical protein
MLTKYGYGRAGSRFFALLSRRRFHGGDLLEGSENKFRGRVCGKKVIRTVEDRVLRI